MLADDMACNPRNPKPGNKYFKLNSFYSYPFSVAITPLCQKHQQPYSIMKTK